jgi:segregation and condensation protein B
VTEQELLRAVEAVLFAADTPVTTDKLCDILEGAKRGDIKKALKALGEHYDSDGHSFMLTEVAGGWQLYARAEHAKWVKELHKGRIPSKLSQAALETLAIVAYRQPIVRAEVEIIRGVDSSGVLATLLRRGLIAIAGRAPGMGRALMYRTTKEFLRYFGLNSVTDLPRLEEFAEVLGLKPEELELAVEGAEAMEGMQAAADLIEEDLSGGENEDGAGSDAEGPASETPESELHEIAGVVSAIATQPGGAEAEAGAEPEADAGTSGSGPVPLPGVDVSGPGAPAAVNPLKNGVHPIGDRELLEKIEKVDET